MEPADSILGPRHPVERRTFMAMIAGGLFAAPLAAEAQQAAKVYRIGVLSQDGPNTNVLRQSLRGFSR